MDSNWHACCHQPRQILLVLSLHATCFGHTNHPKAFKYMILKLKIQCMYILNLGDLTNCTSNITVM